MKISCSTIALWMIAIILILLGVFGWVCAAHIAAFKLHLEVTIALELIFLALFVLDVLCLIGGIGLAAWLSMRTSHRQNQALIEGRPRFQ